MMNKVCHIRMLGEKCLVYCKKDKDKYKDMH